MRKIVIEGPGAVSEVLVHAQQIIGRGAVIGRVVFEALLNVLEREAESCCVVYYALI